MKNLIKFRASSVYKLMTEPRAKSEKLSQTAKTYIKELWIENNYNRKKEITSKFMEKGTLVEEQSITLLTNVTGSFFIKNKENFQNEFVTGTPDLFYKDTIHDIKSSWDIWTFSDAELTSANYWQMVCYLWLTEKQIGFVDYCLVDTPEHLIIDAKRKWAWLNGVIDNDSEEVQKVYEEIERNMTYPDIDEKERVKQFEVNFLLSEVERIAEKVDLAREYYNNLSL